MNLDMETGIALIKSISGANGVIAAKTAAQVAQAAAETAQGKAEAAQTAAETAQGLAEAAQTAAETAQGAAEDVLESIPQDYSEMSADVSNLKSQITSKAETNGGYPEMTVGSAEQLLSAKGLTDKVPYLFRRSGGAGANRAKENAIVGGTIAWNQLAEKRDNLQSQTVNGVTFTYNSTNNTITIDGTASENANLDLTNHNINLKSGHVYFLPPFTGLTKYQYFINGNLANYSGISKPSNDEASRWVEIRIVKNTTVSNIVVKCNPMVIDLTAAFTPAIADYIYNLETATAGAGIAKLKSWGLCIKDYYEYDAGSLQSVQVAGKAITGFNQWDEEWELGSYNSTTGEKQNSAINIRSKNFIPVVPGKVYYLKSKPGTFSFAIMSYDSNKNYIRADFYNGNTLINTVREHSNTRYITFYIGTAYGTTYDHDICLNISDSTRNGEYEPYNGHTYPLDSSLTLRGIPELDADNNLRYNGDVYRADGTVTRKYGIVDLGTLTWEAATSAGKTYSTSLKPLVKKGSNSGGYDHVKSTRYIAQNVSSMGELTNYGISVDDTGNLQICDTTFVSTSGAEIKSALSGSYLVYELQTPTTETADPYQETQLLDPYGTEEYIDAAVTASTPTRDVAIPVGHETYYPENATEKLAGLPWDFSTLIATTEKSFTATKAYSVNDFLIVNNQLYRVTASIANGATITPNTNVTATTIGAQITALLNA